MTWKWVEYRTFKVSNHKHNSLWAHNKVTQPTSWSHWYLLLANCEPQMKRSFCSDGPQSWAQPLTHQLIKQGPHQLTAQLFTFQSPTGRLETECTITATLAYYSPSVGCLVTDFMLCIWLNSCNFSGNWCLVYGAQCLSRSFPCLI